jgi:hypothetical protein
MRVNAVQGSEELIVESRELNFSFCEMLLLEAGS